MNFHIIANSNLDWLLKFFSATILEIPFSLQIDIYIGCLKKLFVLEISFWFQVDIWIECWKKLQVLCWKVLCCIIVSDFLYMSRINHEVILMYILFFADKKKPCFNELLIWFDCKLKFGHYKKILYYIQHQSVYKRQNPYVKLL